MSDGEMDERPKSKLIAGLVSAGVAVAGITGGVWYGLVNEASYEQEAIRQHTDHAERTAEQIKQSCFRLSSSEKAKCIRDAKAEYRLEAYDKRHDAADLVAQRTSALWTSIMGIAALIGTGLSIVGVVLVFITFRETRRATDTAKQALAVSKDVAAAELRPWITISLKLTKFEASDHSIDVDYEVAFKNIGKTAARNLSTRVTSRFIGNNAVDEIDAIYAKWKVDEEKESRFALMPDEQTWHTTKHATARKLIPWFGTKAPMRTHFVSIITAFYWSDIDQSWHRTDRSFTIGRKSPNFIDSRYLYDDMTNIEWVDDDLDMMAVKRFRGGQTT